MRNQICKIVILNGQFSCAKTSSRATSPCKPYERADKDPSAAAIVGEAVCFQSAHGNTYYHVECVSEKVLRQARGEQAAKATPQQTQAAQRSLAQAREEFGDVIVTTKGVVRPDLVTADIANKLFVLHGHLEALVDAAGGLDQLPAYIEACRKIIAGRAVAEVKDDPDCSVPVQSKDDALEQAFGNLR